MSMKTAIRSTSIAIASVLVAAPLAVTPAFAASAQQQIAMCTKALDAQGLTKAGEYRSKFVKSKGGAVKTITLKIYPQNGSGSLTAKCRIKGGSVISANLG